MSSEFLLGAEEMKEGWKLKDGLYQFEDITENQIWQIFSYIFSTKSANRTSYKFGFLKALIESAFDAAIDGSINLNEIFERFARIYWALIVKYSLVQGDKGTRNKSSIELIYYRYIEKYKELKICEFDSIKGEIKDELLKEIVIECKKYVVGAIYADSKGVFYSFSKKGGSLSFNPNVYKFIKKFSSILLKINDYEWIKFLEKVNKGETCFGLAVKLNEASKRGNLVIYKNFLYSELNIKKCFYCGKTVGYCDIHVDHFVPWSFIRNDRLWNFVVSCSKCNLSKSDKLAGKEFLDEIIYRDEFLKQTCFPIVKHEFQNYSSVLVREIYESAVFNGFMYWKSNMKLNHKEIEL
jgi:hypothetical protein